MLGSPSATRPAAGPVPRSCPSRDLTTWTTRRCGSRWLLSVQPGEAGISASGRPSVRSRTRSCENGRDAGGDRSRQGSAALGYASWVSVSMLRAWPSSPS